MVNSMLNHDKIKAVLSYKPPLPQFNVELVSWYIAKGFFGVVYNI